MRSRYIAVMFLWITHKRHPSSPPWRYMVSFVSVKLGRSSATVIVGLGELSCCIWPRYIEESLVYATRLWNYIKHVHFISIYVRNFQLDVSQFVRDIILRVTRSTIVPDIMNTTSRRFATHSYCRLTSVQQNKLEVTIHKFLRRALRCRLK